MDEDHKDKILEHEYDGIRELDNNLPRWWLWLFYITILFSVVYMLWFHVFRFGYSQEERYEASVNEHYEREVSHNPLSILIQPYNSPWYSESRDNRRAMLQAGLTVKGPVGRPGMVEITFDTPLMDALTLEIGRKIYEQQCSVCHAPDGRGTAAGPNLTNEAWIHGGSFPEIVNVIVHGVPIKGMIAWGADGKLTADQIRQVASYIDQELRGKNLPGNDYGH